MANVGGKGLFYSDNRVNFSTYRYCQSATFGPLAFCVCSLFFYDIKSKRISNRHISCDVYIRSECGSCPADVATATRPRTATQDHGRFYSFINTISFHGSRFSYSRVLAQRPTVYCSASDDKQPLYCSF